MVNVIKRDAEFKGLVTIDFETYYDKEYSLSKLTTEEYVRSPLFEVIGVSLITSTGTYWLEEHEFRELVANTDFSQTLLLAHNTQFDGAILGWHYGVRPFMWLDTLSMARALQNNEKSNSLGALAEQFGLGAKGHEVVTAIGKRRKDFAPAEWAQYGVYCKNDSQLTLDLFTMLVKQFPTNELKIIDITLRMFIEPRIVLDQDMLSEAYYEEVDALEALLQRLQIAEKDLASNDKFAAILQGLGVDPPTKISPKTGKTAFAFAKTDIGFQELMDSPDPQIALLCDARLKAKSTLMRTRSQRLYDIATRGALPVPLQFWGCHTGRFSASKQQAINMQNLKRGSKLRRAILAPKGMMFGVGDLKQIEVRVLATLAGFDELLKVLENDDPYAIYGAEMFNVPGMTKESHPTLRQAAKSALLGCFGSQTPVLTERGWVSIIDVSFSDRLWDGEAWVNHRGLIYQGFQETLTAHGISATKDHKILTAQGWLEWQEVHTSSSHFQSALSLVNLPASNGEEKIPGAHGCMRRGCDALAGMRGLAANKVFYQVGRKGARNVGTESPNHRLDTGRKRNSHFFRDMLLGNLHAYHGKIPGWGITLKCGVLVAGKVLLLGKILLKGIRRGAIPAQRKKQQQHVLHRMATGPFALIKSIGSACKTVLVRSLFGAQTQKITGIPIMGGEVLLYLVSGLLTVLNSLSIYSRLTDGIIQNCRLIGLTITLDMNPVICGSALEASICRTKEKFQRERLKSSKCESSILKKKMHTYDLAYCGPNNRYVVLTDNGPIIVHNCGYSLGGFAFAAQLLSGFMGAPPVRYEMPFISAMGYDVMDVMEWLKDTKLTERILTIPHGCTDNQLLIHAFAAFKIIEKYRNKSVPVVNLWGSCKRAIKQMEYNSPTMFLYDAFGLFIEHHKIRLPNAMYLRYPDLRYIEEDGERKQVYGKRSKKIYGGALTENIVQAVARIVMTDAMLRITKELPIVLTVHDEIVCLVPENDAEAATNWMHEQMIVHPHYLPAIKLAVDGGYGKIYGDIK